MATLSDHRLPAKMLASESRKPEIRQAVHPHPWLHFVAGGVAGTTGAVLTCPLEVIKTRMQSSLYKSSGSGIRLPALLRPLSPFIDIGYTLRSLYRQDGVSALFRGLGPNLVGVIPSRAIQFAVYGNGKRILTDLNHGRETSLIHLAAAASAGICTATVTNPIWLVKTRMQLQATSQEIGTYRYKNSLDCVVQVLRTEGIAGLYRGLSASYLGVAEGALQWVLYEHFKKLARDRSESTIDRGNNGDGSTDGWIGMLTAAAMAKFCAAMATYPHEVIRTRLREVSRGGRKYRGLGATFVTIVREEGFKALYGGLPAHMLRVVPNAAIMFFCYEAILAMARSRSSIDL